MRVSGAQHGGGGDQALHDEDAEVGEGEPVEAALYAADIDRGELAEREKADQTGGLADPVGRPGDRDELCPWHLGDVADDEQPERHGAPQGVVAVGLRRIEYTKHEVRADGKHGHHGKADHQGYPQHEAELLRDDRGGCRREREQHGSQVDGHHEQQRGDHPRDVENGALIRPDSDRNDDGDDARRGRHGEVQPVVVDRHREQAAQ